MEVKTQKYASIMTQADAVLHFLQHLDIEMVDSVLDPKFTYQKFEKHIFIRKIGYALDEFIESGDTFLYLYPGQCNGERCNYGCKGFTFIGNNSGNYFDLIVDIRDGVVHDMYECCVFKSSELSISENKCIIIDRLNLKDFI